MGTNYNKWSKFEKELEPDEEDLARERLRKQKEDMSDKEVKRLHECWEQPDFRRMFEEYQEEVTDPKHRAETEEYLAQCEAEQREGKAPPGGDGLSVEQLGAGGLAGGGGGGGGAPPDGAQAPPGKDGSFLRTSSARRR